MNRLCCLVYVVSLGALGCTSAGGVRSDKREADLAAVAADGGYTLAFRDLRPTEHIDDSRLDSLFGEGPSAWRRLFATLVVGVPDGDDPIALTTVNLTAFRIVSPPVGPTAEDLEFRIVWMPIATPLILGMWTGELIGYINFRNDGERWRNLGLTLGGALVVDAGLTAIATGWRTTRNQTKALLHKLRKHDGLAKLQLAGEVVRLHRSGRRESVHFRIEAERDVRTIAAEWREDQLREMFGAAMVELRRQLDNPSDSPAVAPTTVISSGQPAASPTPADR